MAVWSAARESCWRKRRALEKGERGRKGFRSTENWERSWRERESWREKCFGWATWQAERRWIWVDPRVDVIVLGACVSVSVNEAGIAGEASVGVRLGFLRVFVRKRKFKGVTLMPNIGYDSDKKTRHYLPNGIKKLLVHNVKELELLLMHNRKYSAEIAHNVLKNWEE
ncbi:hypothetical protein Droror1_Dr00026016 [Drosera rotundifolia]